MTSSRYSLPLLLAAILPAQERVTFATADEVKLVADWYALEGDAPTLVCLPEAGAMRDAFQALGAALAEAGIQTLALDPATGDSAAIAAAFAFLLKRGADTTRVGLLAARDNVRPAIRAGLGDPHDYRALVLVSPSDTRQIGSAEDMKRWPGQPVAILSAKVDGGDADPFALALLDTDAPLDRFTFADTEAGGSELAKYARSIAAITRFCRASLLHPVLRVPAFAEDDERVQTAGFIRLTCRLSRTVTRDGSAQKYTLLAFAVGDTLTLGAMTDGAFHGAVRWEIGELTLTLPWDTNTSDPVPTRVQGAEELEVVGQPASFRGTSWINVELPLNDLLPEGKCDLRLRLAPREEASVTLPGGEPPFEVRLLRL